jgi:hypothetical protein
MRHSLTTLGKLLRKRICKSLNYNNKTTISCSTSKIIYSALKKRRHWNCAVRKLAQMMSMMRRQLLGQKLLLSMVQRHLRRK